MNIGIFTDTYYPDINGVVTSILMLEKQLIKKGHNVYIFTTTGHKSPDNKNNIFTFKSIPCIASPNYRMGIPFSPTISKKVAELKLDIIHTESEFSAGILGKTLAYKNNIKLVHTYHTIWEHYLHYIMPKKVSTLEISKKIARKMLKRHSKNYSALIACTEETKNYLFEDCGIDKYKIKVVSNGLDLDMFKHDKYNQNDFLSLRKQYGIKDDEKIIGFIGRLAQEKNIEPLIYQLPNILNKIPNIKMMIVGDGPHKNALEKLAKNLNLNDHIVFTGSVEWTKVGLYYSFLDIFLNASISENQSFTYIEAMSSGTPVIAKKAEHIKYLINNSENGLIFDNDNDMVDLIKKLFDDTQLYDKLVKNGIESSKKYGIEHFGDEMEKLYLTILENE